jgi:lipoprotein-anchoring transpeptidase ErfK/SrfK
VTGPRATVRRVPLLTALLAVTAAVLAACTSSTSGQAGGSTKTIFVTPSSSATSSASGSTSSSASSSPTKTRKPKKPAKPVHVSLQMLDGVQVGVGMPIIAYLSRSIKDARFLEKATKVTVNGRQVKGSWYFEYKSGLPGKPIEADWRMPTYWPAHARIHLDLPVKGVSAGPGLAFDDDLTLDFTTGAAHIATVDNATHQMTVTSDGKTWGTFPVSLGASQTRTRRGVKVIMEKVPTVCMHNVQHTYFECGIKWDQRLTYDGEYLHSAPWNCIKGPGCTGPSNNIGHANSSNGCTNLRPADAIRLYHFLQVGDVVRYPNADGQLMQLGDGYGDWNIPWDQWLGGGLYRTS